jgi:hypothetical protein
MVLLPLAVVVAIGACPKVWIVDMAPLPFNSPIGYTFALRFEIGDRKAERLTYQAYKESGPDDIRDLVYVSLLSQRELKVGEVGRLIVIREAAGQPPIRRLTAEGDGPKPLVRWGLAPPPAVRWEPARPPKKK